MSRVEQNLLVSGLVALVVGCGQGVPGGDKGSGNINEAPLNDTGIDFFIDSQTPSTGGGSVATFPQRPASMPFGQDAETGEDPLQLNQNTDGIHAFSFTKLDVSGNPLDPSVTDWSCVRDNRTGLVWENKTGAPSDIHFAGDAYTWFDSNPNTNGGDAGQQAGMMKESGGIACGTTKAKGDTEAFRSNLNAHNMCGYSDWRVPLREELRSLVNYGSATEPMVDTNFFPHLNHMLHFWTAESDVNNPTRAWGFHFQDGTSETHPKSCPQQQQGYHNGVMLVRG